MECSIDNAVMPSPPPLAAQGATALWCVGALHDGEWMLVCVSESVERSMRQANIARARFHDEVEVFTLAPLGDPPGGCAAG